METFYLIDGVELLGGLSSFEAELDSEMINSFIPRGYRLGRPARRPLLISPFKTVGSKKRHMPPSTSFQHSITSPLAYHPFLLPPIAQQFFRQYVMMQTAHQRPISSMAHSLLMSGNSAQQQGALGIPTAAAISVELSNKTIFRFSTTAS